MPVRKYKASGGAVSVKPVWVKRANGTLKAVNEPNLTQSATVEGTGSLLRQDLMPTTATASIDLWGGLNPCGHPEACTVYASGGDTAPLIDGTTNSRYFDMFIYTWMQGCNDTVRTRMLLGNNPANGNATMDNTFAAYDEGQGYAIYFSVKIDPAPPGGSWNGSISQIMEIMPPLASSHPPCLSMYEKEDGTLLWSWRPTGGSTGRIDTNISHTRSGGWRRFCLTLIPGYGNAGYHRLWRWDYGTDDWVSVFEKTGTTIVSGDPDNIFQLWGIYCDNTIPGPRHLSSANWQVCNWTRP